MKMKHKRLFIPVINDIFKKEYPLDITVEILPSERYLTKSETIDVSKEIEEQVSNFLIKIGNEVYLLEYQSYDDGSIAIRIAEHAFIVTRQFAIWDIVHATISNAPIIYIKRTEKQQQTRFFYFAEQSQQTLFMFQLPLKFNQTINKPFYKVNTSIIFHFPYSSHLY